MTEDAHDPEEMIVRRGGEGLHKNMNLDNGLNVTLISTCGATTGASKKDTYNISRPVSWVQ